MIPCPICAHTDAVSFLRGRDHASGEWFELQRCPHCELVFIGSPPTNLADYYHTSYRQYRPWTHRIFRFLYGRHARSWSRQLSHKGRALEIGCGEGWMLAALRSEGWSVVGVERSVASGRFAATENRLPLLVGGLEAFKPVPTFDLIFMHHVLEHLPDPLTTLRHSAALLRPGGSLLVVVPNLASWQFRFARAGWFHLDVPRHLTHFTPAALRHALNRVGLRIENIRFVSIDQDPFGWLVSILNRLGFPQTRWLHWLAGHERGLTLANLGMLVLSLPLLMLGFFLAALSWLAGAGACMEVRAVQGNR